MTLACKAISHAMSLWNEGYGYGRGVGAVVVTGGIGKRQRTPWTMSTNNRWIRLSPVISG